MISNNDTICYIDGDFSIGNLLSNTNVVVLGKVIAAIPYGLKHRTADLRYDYFTIRLSICWSSENPAIS